MHIIMHSILVFQYSVAHLLKVLQYCAMLMLQAILIPALFSCVTFGNSVTVASGGWFYD